MIISRKANDGKEFMLTIEKRSFNDVKKIADIEGVNVSVNQVWFIIEADCFNPKTKKGIIETANIVLTEMISDYNDTH